MKKSKNIQQKIEQELLYDYQSLVDFKNKDQYNNYKWVIQFIKHQQKYHPNEDNVWFLEQLIINHNKNWRI